MYKLYLLTDHKKSLIGEFKTAVKADQTARERATARAIVNKALKTEKPFAFVIIDGNGEFIRAYAREA